MADFSGNTPYSIMFGPDICGYSTQKVHAILTDKKGRNLDLKPFVKAPSDQLTHVFTYILRPNNTYQVCDQCYCVHVNVLLVLRCMCLLKSMCMRFCVYLSMQPARFRPCKVTMTVIGE
jgi:hypothetical protein